MNQPCAVTHYPSGQNGAILPALTTSCVLQEQVSQKPLKKTSLDQAWLVKIDLFLGIYGH